MPKYTIRAPVYLRGKYTHASPSDPQEIELSEAEAKRDGYTEQGGGKVELGKHFVERVGGGVPTSGDIQGRPLDEQQPREKSGKSKRAADGEPI